MSSETSLVEFSVSAEAEDHAQTTVSTRGHEFVVDEPTANGGQDEGPTPVEYLLGAWAGCLTVTGHAVADDHDIAIGSLDIDLAGGLDPRKLQGRADDVRAGFQHIEVELDVESDATEEELDAWLAAVEERCPVADNLASETPTTLGFA
ncbi:OsmC family protein [Salarchaeum sp. JOR-1]|uniref:OsmC family protein n=1 Tax=Salarchaeum sp. JOR-1 TaxID=2599399 RepID=UPI0011983620|nr:OsmC family protein [Salarchaeum sp. JOR-1]QDX40007.1 OsmC family protein [Salarchaeum sp. JOR-1]